MSNTRKAIKSVSDLEPKSQKKILPLSRKTNPIEL